MTQSLARLDSDRLYFAQDGFAQNDDMPVFHGFFGRRGGVSEDIYASLNCGQGSDDHQKRVQQNRQIVSEVVGCGSDHLLSVHQVHGAHCVRASEPWASENKPKADACVTNVPGIALSVLTADCAPVLFSGQDGDGQPVVAAAHAGWGGALKGVLEATIEQMGILGADLQSIKACIEPCIGQKSYEVGDEFAEPFIEEEAENERFFMAAQKDGHLMFDLPGYCAAKLAKNGVKDVMIQDMDTYAHEDHFFSYRRTTHRGEKDYGRQISVIMIQDRG